MTNLRKLFVFAPVMLLSLTACEAKIDEAKAKERAKEYNATEVAKKYKSFDEKTEFKITKQSGDFAKGGKLYSLVALIEAFATDMEEKDVAVEEGMYTTTAFDDLLESAQETVKGEPVLEYYSYKSTGLKVVANIKQDTEEDGLKSKGDAKVTMYVLDDGRIEKADGLIKMSMEGKYPLAEGDVKGSFEMTIKATYTWNKA